MSTQHPVSLTFLCAAEKVLRKEHGERLFGKESNRWLDLLGQVEELWQTLPKPEKKRKVKR